MLLSKKLKKSDIFKSWSVILQVKKFSPGRISPQGDTTRYPNHNDERSNSRDDDDCCHELHARKRVVLYWTLMQKNNKSETINIILKNIKKTKQAYIPLWY